MGYLLFGLQGGHGGPTDREGAEVEIAASLVAKTKAHHAATPKTRSNISMDVMSCKRIGRLCSKLLQQDQECHEARVGIVV